MTVWRTVLPWFVLAVVLAIGGGVGYAHFFTVKPKDPQAAANPVDATAPRPTAAVAPPVAQAPTASPPKVDKPKRPTMPPEASYIWDLSDKAKPRLAGVMDIGGGQFAGIVEWRADQSRVLERLTVEQIRALGVMVDRRGYGLRLSWGLGKDMQVIVVTAWPVDEQYRYSQQQIQDIRENSPPIPPAMGVQAAAQSLSQAPAGQGSGQGGAAHYAPWVASQSYTPPELTRAPR